MNKWRKIERMRNIQLEKVKVRICSRMILYPSLFSQSFKLISTLSIRTSSFAVPESQYIHKLPYSDKFNISGVTRPFHDVKS